MNLLRTSLALLVALAAATSALAQIVVESVTRSTPGGTVRGYLAFVDLTNPRVSIRTTDAAPPGDGDAVLTRTDNWRSTVGATLAINANYFGTLTAPRADIVGLSMTDGLTVSPPRSFNGAFDPALVFDANKSARIGNFGPADLAGAWDAVAGVGPSTSDNVPGTLLVTDGANTGATARVDPANRNPRTAVALNRNATTLIIAVIDGRQNNWSVGMTLPELADLLIERGAWRAINLDGGGSSSFVYRQPSGSITQNRPSDGAHRAVANHLGIVLAADSQWRAARPVRGVWLRGSADLAALETSYANLASAGITDVYLDTFYYGLTISAEGVFRTRYSQFDYLASAIDLASRYGLRVHTWLETAYWQYQASGSYNFTNFYDYQVISTATNLPGGDQAQQVFANLAHPGVQAKMRAYCTELASYPGLWGIQTDYHRYPLDDNTGDAFTAPWSYDLYSRTAFRDLYPGVNISTSARQPGQPYWNQFLAWRREGIAQAANQMRQGIDAVAPGMPFSAAVFAKATIDSTQLTKCQDWPSWTTRDYIDVVAPMAYGTSTASITSDVSAALSFAAGKRVFPGLALTGTVAHPSITIQLNAIRGLGVEDFIFFEGSVFSDPARRTELRNWLIANARFQRADFNNDNVIDQRDRALFATIYNGTPVSAGGANARYNLNGDAVVDDADLALLKSALISFRFGEDARVDPLDRQAFQNAFTGPGPGTLGPYQSLYDIDADGDVDNDDLAIVNELSPPPACPADFNNDGFLDFFDFDDFVTAFSAGGPTADFNADGFVDFFDFDDFTLAFELGC
jgi:uncharacterized lipoprotein YddW (UPF0748 family)